MPNYPGAALATVPAASNISPIALHKGESHYLFGTLASTATQLPITAANVTGESPAAGTPSIAICLQVPAAGDGPPMVCIEGIFSGAPGAFEIDIQEADTDADAYYTTPSNPAYTITAVGGNQQFRVDLSPTGGKFMRAKLASRTNAVSLKLKATRLA